MKSYFAIEQKWLEYFRLVNAEFAFHVDGRTSKLFPSQEAGRMLSLTS